MDITDDGKFVGDSKGSSLSPGYDIDVTKSWPVTSPLATAQAGHTAGRCEPLAARQPKSIPPIIFYQACKCQAALPSRSSAEQLPACLMISFIL